MCVCVCVCEHAQLCLTLQPHGQKPQGLYPARLFCPWNFACKNTGAGCHFFLQGVFLTQGASYTSYINRWILDRCTTWEQLISGRLVKLIIAQLFWRRLCIHLKWNRSTYTNIEQYSWYIVELEKSIVSFLWKFKHILVWMYMDCYVHTPTQRK